MSTTIIKVKNTEAHFELMEGERFQKIARVPWDASALTYTGKIYRKNSAKTELATITTSVDASMFATSDYSEVTYYVTSATLINDVGTGIFGWELWQEGTPPVFIAGGDLEIKDSGCYG